MEKEYLRNFHPELLSGDIDQMLEANRPQDKVTLIEYLEQAFEHL